MQVQCKKCKGTGIVHPNLFPTSCPVCNGRGHIDENFIKEQTEFFRTNGINTLTYQEGGDHYVTMPIQPWEIIDAHNLNFYEGNIIKYLLREKVGNDRVMELKKAKHYLEHLIELEEKYAQA